jgi:hypothetical protein
MINDNRAEKAVEYLRDNAKLYGQAKANRIYLEEFRKVKKALGMKDAELDGVNSAAAQEREAYAGADYLELITGLRAAVEAEERIRWEMEAARMTVEVWRTQSANNRTIDRSAE